MPKNVIFSDILVLVSSRSSQPSASSMIYSTTSPITSMNTVTASQSPGMYSIHWLVFKATGRPSTLTFLYNLFLRPKPLGYGGSGQ